MKKKHDKMGIFDPSEAALDSLESMADQTWHEDMYLEGKDNLHMQGITEMDTSLSKQKYFLFVGFFFFSLLIILGRLVYLQLLSDDQYFVRAEGNRQRNVPIVAERGIIYDVNGIQLTKNIPKFSLTLIPQDLPRTQKEREALVVTLAEIIGSTTEEIRSTIEEYGSYSYESIVIQDNLDYETALSVQIAAAELPGIFVQRGSKRLYQAGEDPETGDPIPVGTLSHILGYEGKLNAEELEQLYKKGYLPSDFIGKTGIERTYEQDLRGIYGKKRIEVNALGKEQAVLSESAPYPGNQIYLTIDVPLQQTIETILEEELTKADKTNAVVVAMNPQNGSIQAMVSWPAFDNNDFSGGIDQETYSGYIEDEARPLFNRAIGGAYPSGSTVKPAIAAAALQEGIITANTTFRSTGGIEVGQWFFPDWQAGGHGITDVKKSIAWSVNTFYYYIGGGFEDFVGLGVEKIVNYLELFGMANVLGVDIPGEVPGFLPSKQWKEETKGERWYVGDTYNVSIGQGDLLATPMQIAALTSVIANGGKLYQPYFVDRIVDPVTLDSIQTEPYIIREGFIDPWHIETIQEGMRDCVTYGSCQRLDHLPFAVAGKTGTAQWSSVKENHAWFSSFAPYENPEIVLVVLVEEGEGGSKIAAPIADKIYDWWWQYRNGVTNEPLGVGERVDE